MRTTYLFTAVAALLVASIPASADGECMQWQRGRNGAIVQACVWQGADAAGLGYAIADEDPIGNTGEPGLLYASPNGDLVFQPAVRCTECVGGSESEEQRDALDDED